MSEPGDRPAAAAPAEDPALLFEHLWRLGRQPNVQDFLRSAGKLTPSQIVSVLCIDQWKRWQLGEHVPAEEHLGMHPDLNGTDEAVDLIFGEFLLREELEEAPKIEEYLKRFPQYETQLRKQFDFHSAIAAESITNPARSQSSASISDISQAGDSSVLLGGEATSRGAPRRPKVPGYEILGELGRGGMGHVFKARQQRLNRIVALKIIRQERLAQDKEAIRRFEREARAAAQLSHPNIVVVYDADQVDGNYFIAMEYVEGIDLFEYVKQSGPLPIEQACDYIRQACLGLQHAYERGMVHRDIKPSNLLVTMPKPGKGNISGFQVLPTISGRTKSGEQGAKSGEQSTKSRAQNTKSAATTPAPGSIRVKPLGLSSMGTGPAGVVKILDMGLALVTHSADSESGRWTQEGAFMGTPDFIAPEQALNSRNVDIRADLYSLGCTLYFLLCGKAPFGNHPLIQKLMMHQTTEPPAIEQLRPDVPAKVAVILRRMMAKKLEERFQTPLELADALAALKVSDFAPGPVAATKPVAPTTSPLQDTARPSTDKTMILAGPAKPVFETVPPPAASVASSPPAASVASSPAASPTAADAHAYIVKKWSQKKSEAVAATKPENEGLDKPEKICVLQGHRGWVTSVTFSCDRSTLASGGVDGALRLWDVGASEPRDRDVPQAHSSDLVALAFAPSNKLVATGASNLDGVVRLWDVSDEPRQLAPVRVGGETVDCLAFSPDSRLLAVGGSNKNVRLWDVSGPEPQARAVLKGHTDFVKSFVFSHDGSLLVTAGKDTTIRLWNLARYWSKEMAVLQGRWGQVQTVAFAADDRSLAFGSIDQTVRVWDLTSGSPFERIILRGHIGVVRLVQFNPDGTLLSICDGGRIILWNVAEGKKLREWLLPRAKVYSMAMTHDGRYLATGNNDGSVSVYRLYAKRAEPADQEQAK